MRDDLRRYRSALVQRSCILALAAILIFIFFKFINLKNAQIIISFILVALGGIYSARGSDFSSLVPRGGKKIARLYRLWISHHRSFGWTLTILGSSMAVYANFFLK